MFRKTAAIIAALMICLPVGGNLHVALGTGHGHALAFRVPSEAMQVGELMVVYPCLFILVLVLHRSRKRKRAGEL